MPSVRGIYNREEFERSTMAMDDDALFRMLFMQQGAMNALTILLANGGTRDVAQDMLAGLQLQTKFAADLAVKRGIATVTEVTASKAH